MENLKENKGSYKSEYYLMNRIRILEYQKAYHFRTNTPEKILRQRKYNAEYYKKNKHKWNKRPANKSVEERPQHNSKNIKPIETEPKKLSFWINF
jgi:hypothetical protein